MKTLTQEIDKILQKQDFVVIFLILIDLEFSEDIH